MFSKKLKLSISLIAVILAVLYPVLTGASLYTLTLMIIMLVFIIYASSWNFLIYTGQGSLGHAAFFGIGAYASTLIAVTYGLPPFLSIFLGGTFAAVAGLFIGLICVRLKEWFLAMVTFGFAIIMQTITVSLCGDVSGGWDGIASPRLISSTVSNYILYEYYLILAVTCVVIIIFYFILESKIGLAFTAIKENEEEAMAAGINPMKYKLLAFTISTYFAGVAGALEVHYFAYISPEIYAVDISFWPIIYSMAGGMGTLAGPIIGTISVTVLWESMRGLGFTYESYIVIGVLLVLIVIFFPQGLVSLPKKLKERWDQYRELRKDSSDE